MSRSLAPRVTPQGNELFNAHLKRGWSQQQMAEAIGTLRGTVSRWERGESVPSPYYRQRLAQLFEKTPEELGFVSEGNEAKGNLAASLHPSSMERNLDQLLNPTLDSFLPEKDVADGYVRKSLRAREAL